jgi:uncharacterized protein (TIRG00374 family)
LFKNIKRNIFLLFAAAALFYLIVSFFSDYKSVAGAIKNFKLYLLPVLILLAFINFLIRFLKWQYYLNLLKIKISKKDSFGIFMSSLVMLATPGAMGEMLKSYFVKKITGERISKTAPIVIAERTTDIISLIIAALAGAFFFKFGEWMIIFLLLFFILLILIISRKNVSLKFLDFISRVRFIDNYISKMHLAYESVHLMLKGKHLVFMILLSTAAWLFEFFSFYLISINLGINISFFLASFIYAFAMLAGSVTMLPGGIGVTDGSLIFLLTRSGGKENAAIAATFIIRLIFLWFAVGVGALSSIIYNYRFGSLVEVTEEEAI